MVLGALGSQVQAALSGIFIVTKLRHGSGSGCNKSQMGNLLSARGRQFVTVFFDSQHGLLQSAGFSNFFSRSLRALDDGLCSLHF